MNTEPKPTTAEDLIAELRKESEGAVRREPKEATVIELQPESVATNESAEAQGTFDEPAKPKAEAAEVKNWTPDQAKTTAISWVKRFSSVMKIIFTPLYRKTILAPGDAEKMQNFVRANKALNEKEKEAAMHSDHELSKVADRFDKYIKACEDIPLNADEIEDLAQPLSELIIKYKNLQLGPEWMLAIAAGFITLPRLAPLMPDMSKIFAGGDK